jgi:catechol 2,3-dioxygenase-like lactoylglutathione lyase family enzyme
MAGVSNWLLDHPGIGVTDIVRSAKFYEAALRPLGAKVVMRIDSTMALADDGDGNLAGVAFGDEYTSFWLDVFHPTGVKQHTAFRATSREAVEDFHRHGLAAGGVDNGAPGLRLDGYPEAYYAAFLYDPDGNNVEAVYRESRAPT